MTSIHGGKSNPTPPASADDDDAFSESSCVCAKWARKASFVSLTLGRFLILTALDSKFL